ncbi:12070_t:CDS:2, partial [Cetraspora pellucida]
EIKTRLESFTKEQINWAQRKAEIAAEQMATFQAAVGLRKELSVLLTEAEAENDYEKLIGTENKREKLEVYQQQFEKFRNDFVNKVKNSTRAEIWQKKNEGYSPPNFYGKSANASLPELERKAQQEVWTNEELTALEKEIAEFPPYIEKQPEPKYYRGFQVNYQNQEAINQRLERAKEGAKKNAADYQAAIKDIDTILDKNVELDYRITAFLIE